MTNLCACGTLAALCLLAACGGSSALRPAGPPMLPSGTLTPAEEVRFECARIYYGDLDVVPPIVDYVPADARCRIESAWPSIGRDGRQSEYVYQLEDGSYANRIRLPAGQHCRRYATTRGLVGEVCNAVGWQAGLREDQFWSACAEECGA